MELNKKPLIEWMTFDDNPEYLTEEEKRMRDAGEKYFLSGVIQRAEAQNGNKRVYPKPILEKEINNYMKLVKERRAVGELDHPDDAVVNLKNASHLVTKIWWDGNDVLGKIEVLNTSSGKELKALIDADIKLGISSRGMGSTSQRGGQTLVEDDYQLICFDIVSEPSTDGAFMMRENKIITSAEDQEIFDKGYTINRKLNSILS